MPKIYDEQVDFTTTSVSTNQKDGASIQPIVGGENLWENVLNRTPENLRLRTEALRTAVEDLKYYADYDRALVLSASSTTFECISDTDGYKLVMTGGPLWIYPALTPGRNSGGRVRGARMFVQNGSWLPYAGTLGTNDLTFIATGEFTGMRGYAESDDMSLGSFTVGGNRLMISLVANPAIVGGSSSISATVTGSPETLITITYGTLTTATTINQIAAWIVADLNSQGAYGLAHMIRAVTTSAGTSAPPAITNGVFQGGYDAEGHQITDFTTFFNVFVNGQYANRLQEGESLALSFVSGPVEAATGATGGRRQALFDLPTGRTGTNTPNTLSNAVLFNTGREPEKIPGAIPLGKLIDGKFVFVDGTTIGTAAISLGESGVTLARLAALTGASMVGYDGSGNWNADATTNPALVSATVGAALDEIVTRLGGIATGNSGARRIGVEGVYGSASLGNTALDLVAGITSLRNALTQILNATGSATTSGGVNARVSEYGHRMQGFKPLEKVFSATTPVDTTGGGAQMLRAVLNKAPTGIFNGSQVEEQAELQLKPLTYPVNSGDDNLLVQENVDFSTDSVVFTAMSAARARVLQRRTSTKSTTGGLHCIVFVGGISGAGETDGYYFANVLDPDAASPTLSLRRLNGTTPDFTGAASGSGKITFYLTAIEGNNALGAQSRRMRPVGAPAADTVFFGSGVMTQAIDEYNVVQHEEQAAGAYWNATASAPIAGRLGTGATTVTGASSGRIRISGLSGMTTDSVGRYLTLTLASNAANNGKFLIAAYVDSAKVDVANPAGVTGGTGISWHEERAAVRRTNHILIGEDYELLNGLEYGSPVDATANHNHGLAYANVTLPALNVLPAGNIAWTGAGATSVALDDLPDYLNSAQALAFAPSANHNITGFFLEIYVFITTTTAASPKAQWSCDIMASPGTAYVTTNSRSVFSQTGYKVNNNGVADVYSFIHTVLVPVDSSGRATFSLTSSTLVDTTNSSVSVRPTGVVSVRI
jgi:hypothetical protein